MKTNLRALFVALVCSSHIVPAHAVFEQSTNCLPNGATPPAANTYKPYIVSAIVYQDSVSRYVAVGVDWGTNFSFLQGNALGAEIKFHHYNYDSAAVTGKGPAYVLGPGGFAYCDIPGCYLDSDFQSATNTAGEYSEPQVGFGMAPGNAGALSAKPSRIAFTRAVSGRGNKSLVKVHVRATKTVIPGIGATGIFLCGDIPLDDVVSFQEGVYSPVCFFRQKDSQGRNLTLQQWYSC